MASGIKGVFAALLSGVFCCAATSAASAYFSPHVERGSPYMQALVAGPMPADPGEQLVLMETFLLAEDLNSHNAIQRYLVAQSLARIEGSEWKPSATVAEALARSDLDARQERIDEVIAKSVESTPVVDEHEAADALALQRVRGQPTPVPGLWETTLSGQQPDSLAAVYRVRNAGKAKITELNLKVVFDDKAIRPDMTCQAAGAVHTLEPGGSALYICRIYAKALIERITTAWAASGTAPATRVTNIAFGDLGVIFFGGSVGTLYKGRNMMLETDAKLRAAGCQVREGCIRDAEAWVSETNPLFFIAAGLLVPALIAGFFVGRRARRPGRVLLRVFLGMCALVLLAAASAIAWGEAYWMIAMAAVAVVGLIIAVVVMVGMLIGWAIAQSMRK